MSLLFTVLLRAARSGPRWRLRHEPTSSSVTLASLARTHLSAAAKSLGHPVFATSRRADIFCVVQCNSALSSLSRRDRPPLYCRTPPAVILGRRWMRFSGCIGIGAAVSFGNVVATLANRATHRSMCSSGLDNGLPTLTSLPAKPPPPAPWGGVGAKVVSTRSRGVSPGLSPHPLPDATRRGWHHSYASRGWRP